MTSPNDQVDFPPENHLFQVSPVTGRTGAEIIGVSLSKSLDDRTIAAIRSALLRYKVIFFRDQHDMSDRAQEEFAAQLGEPVAHPTAPVVPGTRFLLDLNSEAGYGAASWHTDVTFVPAYPMASMLRALEVPRAGGDTMWANTAAAYDSLPEPLRDLADGLTAIHSNVYDDTRKYRDRAARESERRVFASTVYETEHPVVRVHPESGERTLIVGHFLRQFVGLTVADSERFRTTLQEHITQPEHTVRWRWRAGDVAIWDNRATQHRAVADYDLSLCRHLRRVTMAGDLPIGVNGFTSRPAS